MTGARTIVFLSAALCVLCRTPNAQRDAPRPQQLPIATLTQEPPELPPAAPWRIGATRFHEFEGPSSWEDRPALHRVEGNFGAGPFEYYGVFLHSGELVLETVDLHIPGRGLDFRFARKYRSRLGRDTVMGNGWTHSYDISLKSSGANPLKYQPSDSLVLNTGWGQSFELVDNGQGVFSTSGLFLECALVNGTNIDQFVVEFPDQGKWWFRALDGDESAGKIDRIVDRNGNTMLFGYDASGLLVSIADAMGRVVNLRYTNGRLSSVEDDTGREVRYDYYGPSDPDGTEGDLKSVRSPLVVGTPHGNDFPNGKTTNYTYTSGFSDPDLNSNLTAVIDGEGRAVFNTKYTKAGVGINHDQVESMHHVEREHVSFTYQKIIQEPGFLVIVNDLAGNVREYSYDLRSRLQSVRQFSGRAEPNTPTTKNSNRPANKLRSSDPDYFETAYQWDEDHLLTSVIRSTSSGPLPEQIHYDYSDGSPRARGNLISRARVQVGSNLQTRMEVLGYDPLHNLLIEWIRPDGLSTHWIREPANGNVLQIIQPDPTVIDDFEYNTFGQLTAHVFPETEHQGNPYRQRNEYTYHNTGVETGYLESEIVDVNGAALTTTYNYDSLGNVTALTDPNGGVRLQVFNTLQQLVRVESPEVLLDGQPRRYHRHLFYDAADQLVQVDVENVDELGQGETDPYTTMRCQYDALGALVRQEWEIEPDTYSVIECEYHPGHQLMRFPHAVSGVDPFAVRRVEYDERGLLFREVHAPGHPTDELASEFVYDGMGRAVEVRVGSANQTLITQKGFEVDHTWVRDPMGNQWQYEYDDMGNLNRAVLYGELIDNPGTTNNVRLFERTWQYDILGNPIEEAIALFDPRTQNDIDDGWWTTVFTYDKRGRILSATQDQAETVVYEYDSAGRGVVQVKTGANHAVSRTLRS